MTKGMVRHHFDDRSKILLGQHGQNVLGDDVSHLCWGVYDFRSATDVGFSVGELVG